MKRTFAPLFALLLLLTVLTACAVRVQTVPVGLRVQAQTFSKDDCKKGGWASLHRLDGTAFRNQGDCVKYAEARR